MFVSSVIQLGYILNSINRTLKKPLLIAVFDPSLLSRTITHHLQPVSVNKLTNYGMKQTKAFYISGCLNISRNVELRHWFCGFTLNLKA